jgi:hypothetical protein
MEFLAGIAVAVGLGYWYVKSNFGSVDAFRNAAAKAKAARSVI